MSSSSVAYVVAPNPNFNVAPIPYTAFDGASAVVPGGGGSSVMKTSADVFPAGTYIVSTEVAVNFTGSASGTAADVIYFYFYATTGTPPIFPNCTLPTAVPGTGNVFSATLVGMIVLPVASTITLWMTNTGSATGKTCAWNGTNFQRIA